MYFLGELAWRLEKTRNVFLVSDGIDLLFPDVNTVVVISAVLGVEFI